MKKETNEIKNTTQHLKWEFNKHIEDFKKSNRNPGNKNFFKSNKKYS
jgi:hypothetical protein